MLYLCSVAFGSILLLCIVIYTPAHINYSWVTGKIYGTGFNRLSDKWCCKCVTEKKTIVNRNQVLCSANYSMSTPTIIWRPRDQGFIFLECSLTISESFDNFVLCIEEEKIRSTQTSSIWKKIHYFYLYFCYHSPISSFHKIVSIFLEFYYLLQYIKKTDFFSFLKQDSEISFNFF